MPRKRNRRSKKRQKKRRASRRSGGLNKHHIFPRSRFPGREDNLVMLPVKLHAAWHQIFVNMTVEEAHTFIDVVMVSDKVWKRSDIAELIRRIKRS